MKFENDPGAALISFSRNDEAAKAYHSSEPVFNNRFIKLFWHRPSNKTAADKPGGMNPTAFGAEQRNPGGVYARLGPVNQPDSRPSTSDYNPEEVCTFAD